jgi:hypothetical protein
MTDQRKKEKKSTTISRCHKGQNLNLTDTKKKHLDEQESGRIDFTMGKYVVWAVQLKMFTNNDLYFKFVWQSVFLSRKSRI